MRAKLGDIFEISSGGTPSKSHPEYYGGDIPWVKTGDLKKEYLYEVEDFITEEGLKNSSAKMYESDTVLIAMYGATIGATSILKMNACTNQACAAFKKNEQVIPEYLYYFLRSQKDKFVKDGVGGAQPNISAGYLKKVEMELPSIDEQRIIVNILDKISNIIVNRNQEMISLDDLIKARFIELFGDLKTNSKGWQIVGFKDCADIDTNMVHDFEGYEDYPHIGIDSIEKETGRLIGYRTIAEDGIISGKYLFTPEHIIYSKIRPNLNKVAMPDFDGLCSADAYPILVKEGICNREYFGYTLRSQYFLDYILAFSNRTNLPKVNKSQVEGFVLPLPPIEVQEQFAAFVVQTDKSKDSVQKALDEAQLLFDSLMQQYFG